jgi:hypothetical protein
MELEYLDSTSLVGREYDSDFSLDIESEQSAIDVSEAVDLFQAERKQLESESRDYMKKSIDPEAVGEPFDLKGYLLDSNAKAGAKEKKMGLVIKNLTVVGEAPETSTIVTNVTMFTSLFRMCLPSYW